MRLRSIILFLSLLAFLSTSIGGYIYYSSFSKAVFKEAERRAVIHFELLKKNFTSILSENLKPVKAMAKMDELLEALIHPNPETFMNANNLLDTFKESLEVDVCYLMNYEGITVATSNRNDPDSFLFQNFSFRPYFQRAFHSAPATYFGVGVISKVRGAYYSFPVFEKGEDIPIGLAVIKVSMDHIEQRLNVDDSEIVLLTDPNGIIFISTKKEWRFHTIKKLSDDQVNKITKSRQLGDGPWEFLGLEFYNDNTAKDLKDNQYIVKTSSIENYPGWSFIYLKNIQSISEVVSYPLTRITGMVVFSLIIFVGMLVFILYRKASDEIIRRIKVENALRISENRYRCLYHNTPAMLHSIDTEGYLVSVSNYWTEVMGYEREEVIGRKITDFFTSESRKYAENHVFHEFFKKGFCKEVPYQYVKKNGEVIDILLSAIADRDSDGNIIRSLTVSIDVTERNRAEKALKEAKDTLSKYSKELQKQVHKKTEEFTTILRYTPAVVYIKDRNGCYILVNPKYEELFGVKNRDVQGKTDYDFLEKEVADQFRVNDKQVLTAGRSIQVEEKIPQDGNIHTYLSVKFPIYEESGNIRGICGIATDITELKKIQDQLRRLSGSIMANQEKERSAIARELHDELGQVLTVLRMDATWIRDRCSDIDPKASLRAFSMCELIDNTIEEVRNLAIRLRPKILDHLGLVDALEWYTTDFEKRSNISCVLRYDNIPIIQGPVAIAAYRIAQEALTNVFRHSLADKVELTLKMKESFLVLSVKDDGKGFDSVNLSDSEGLGLAGMRERASLVNGFFEIHSKIGKGTTVQFKVPVSSALGKGLEQ